MKDAIGVPEDQLRQAARSAVCKINIDTDGRMVMTATIRKVFAESPGEFDPRKYLGPARTALDGIVVAVKSQRDALTARTRAASQTPEPGAAAYSIPATSSDEAALGLVATLLAAISQAAAVGVASATTDVSTAVGDLVDASTLGLPLGMGLAEYPGWPDS